MSEARELSRRCPKCGWFLAKLTAVQLDPACSMAKIELQTKCPNKKCRRPDSVIVTIRDKP